MKYAYAYKTPDGVRHEAAIEAASREAVFAALRARGIRAIKVVAADGSKANGEIVRYGVRKRIVVALALAAALAAGVAAYRAGRGAARAVPREVGCARHWIGADVKALFARPGEELLARFAQPGMAVDEARLPRIDAAFAADFRAALEEPVAFAPDEDARAAELKRIVIGLKREAAMHLQDGADLDSLVRFLVLRQRMESRLRRQLVDGVAAASAAERPRRLREAQETAETLGLEPISGEDLK